MFLSYRNFNCTLELTSREYHFDSTVVKLWLNHHACFEIFILLLCSLRMLFVKYFLNYRTKVENKVICKHLCNHLILARTISGFRIHKICSIL